jgi:hypothetical protein
MTLKKALEGDDLDIINLYLQIVYQNEGLGAVTKAFEGTKKYSFYELNGILTLLRCNAFYENMWLKDPTKSILIELNNNDDND